MDNCLQHLQATFESLSLEDQLPFTQSVLAILSKSKKEQSILQVVGVDGGDDGDGGVQDQEPAMELEPLFETESVDSNDPNLDITGSTLWRKCFDIVNTSPHTVKKEICP